jgi:hypothetical protein
LFEHAAVAAYQRLLLLQLSQLTSEKRFKELQML